MVLKTPGQNDQDDNYGGPVGQHFVTAPPPPPPPAPTFETFNFAYELSGNFLTGLSIADDIPGTKIVDPAAGDVKVEDPNGGKISLGQTTDVKSEGFEIDPKFKVGSDYVFIAQADVKDHGDTLSGIVIENSTTGKFYFLTDDQFTGKIAGQNGNLTITSFQDSYCFLAGTLIRTLDGDVAVESIKRGDLVVTQDGRSVPVDWLGIQTVSQRFADKMRVLPIRIRAGALGEGVPSRDLLLSPDHAVLVEGALIQAGALVNGTSVIRETNVPMTFTYYHVEVEDHSLILAENTAAETFVDNVDRLAFDNWAEHQALYPDGKQVNELPYPRAKSHRQVPVAIRVMLGARAQAIGVTESSAVA
jgi:Hint domain